MAKKIKVAGYTQKINYTDGISYRPFSTLNNDVVNDNTFVSGDFNVSVNIDSKSNKTFRSKDFTDYMSLNTIGMNDSLLETYNNQKTKLKLNPTILKNYAYFGSLKERLRVAMENIIIHFPAGLKVNTYRTINGDIQDTGSVEEYFVDSEGQWLRFDLRNMDNPFGIKCKSSDVGSLLFNTENKWRDLTQNYLKYTIYAPELNLSFPVLGFNEESLNSVSLRVDITLDELHLLNSTYLMIRPNDYEVESFFMGLDQLESELLNRQSTPKYTYSFRTRKFTDMGIFIESNETGTWNTLDGWNLDFQNGDYIEYATNLIKIAEEVDSNSANLIIRQMVTSSLLDYDTVSTDIYENIYDTSQKIKTILSIYGRSFDDVKNHIDGISFATNVSYDETDNAPDKYIRDIAKSMGWEMFETKSVIDMVTNIYDRNVENPTLKLTPDELEVEIWRRLILNTPYLMKSKGTRKAIEFINRFLGIPKGLFEFNEYVYKAKNTINVSDVELIQYNMQGYSDIYNLPIDNDGYPRPNPDNDDVYYQQSGGWFSVTGGENSEIDVTTGNNPHMGGYDSGKKYLGQFQNIIPDFEPITITINNTTENVENLITAFTNGSFENNLGTVLVNDSVAQIKVEPKLPKTNVIDNCGCIVTDVTSALSVIPVEYTEVFDCGYDKATFNELGFVDFYNGVNQIVPTEECCSSIGGLFRYNYTLGRYTCEFSPFIDCARYEFIGFDVSNYYSVAQFTDLETNTIVTVVPSAECCPIGSEPYLFEYDNTYSCREIILGEDIRQKCIRIDSVHNLNNVESSTYIEFDLFQYNQPHIEVLDVPNSLYNVDKYAKLNNSGGVIKFVHQGSENIIGRGIFEENSGTHLLPNDMTHTVSVTHSSNPTMKINITYTYVDCPPFIGSTECFRISTITPIIPANEPNIKIYYDSMLSGAMMIEKPSNITINLDTDYMGLNTTHYSGVLTMVVDDEVKEIQLSTLGLSLNNTTSVSFNFNNGKQYKALITRVTCSSCNYVELGTGTLNSYIQSAPPFEIVTFKNYGSTNFTHIQNSSECCPYGSVGATYNGVNYCKKVLMLPNNNFCLEWDDIVYADPIFGMPQLTTFPFFYSDVNSIEMGFIGEVTPTQGMEILNTNNSTGFVIGSVENVLSPISNPIGILNSPNRRYVVKHTDFGNRQYITEEVITVRNLTTNNTVRVMLKPRLVINEPCTPQQVQIVDPCINLGTISVSDSLLNPLPVNFIRVDELNTSGRILSRKYVDLLNEDLELPTITTDVSVQIYPIINSNIGSIDSSARTLTLENNVLLAKQSVTDLYLDRTTITIEDFYLPNTGSPNRVEVDLGGIRRITPCDTSGDIRQPITNLPTLPINPYPTTPTPDPILDPCISLPNVQIADIGSLDDRLDYLQINVINAKNSATVYNSKQFIRETFDLPSIGVDEILEVYPVVLSDIGKVDRGSKKMSIDYDSLLTSVGDSGLSFVAESITRPSVNNVGTFIIADPIVRVPCIEREILTNECLSMGNLEVTELTEPVQLSIMANDDIIEYPLKSASDIMLRDIDFNLTPVTISPVLGVISNGVIDHNIIGDYEPSTLSLTLKKATTPFVSNLKSFDVAIANPNNLTRIGTIKIPIINCDE